MRSRPAEDAQDVIGFVFDLPVGEAQWGRAGGGVRLEAQRKDEAVQSARGV